MPTKIPSAQMQIQPPKNHIVFGAGNYIDSNCGSDCSDRNGFIYPEEKETEVEL